MAETALPASTNNNMKRKLEDNSTTEQSDARNQQTQRDLLEVLQRHDTAPSFLQHTLRPASASSEPSHKKARLSEPQSDVSSIYTKLSDARYTSLQLLKADASRVSEDLVSSIRTKPKDGRPSVEDLKLINRIQHFEAKLKEFVDTEEKHVKVEPKEEAEENETTSAASTRKVGTVLTLFGNAPTPKQLFSSVQNASTNRKDSMIKAELPVDEMNLPNGITATKIVPVSANDSKKGPTFEETFPPALNLPALNPPKASKRSPTRNATINWEFKDPIQRNSKKGGYTVQALTVGGWLGYGGVDPLSDPSREKRKQRDRALSGGEKSEPPPTQASLDDALAKEEAALFRRAYSSYAPTCDNSNVVVPEIEKNTVWWNKLGHARFTSSTFALDPALLDHSQPPSSLLPLEISEPEDLITDSQLDNVLENLNDLSSEEEIDLPQQVHSKTDIQAVLHQISSLLETLASHQRIRTAILPASRVVAPISPRAGPISTKSAGQPSEPSEDEISTYKTLQRELAYLVLQLPPYVLAKIDGVQGGELGVNTAITFSSKNVRGSAEEDLVTRAAKAAATQTAQSLGANRPSSSSAGQQQQHYSATAQRTPAIGQAALTRYGGQQYPGRAAVPAPAPPHFGRGASTTQQTSYGTPGSVGRGAAGYGGANSTYNRPSATYGSGGGQFYGGGGGAARPLTTTTTTTGMFGSLGQFQQQGGGASQRAAPLPTFPPSTSTTTTYPPRPSSGVANYAVGTPQFPRTASPATGGGGYGSPMLPAQQQFAAAQNRQNAGNLYPGQQQLHGGGGGGSGRGTPVNGYGSGPGTPVNGFGGQQRSLAPQGSARVGSGTPQPLGGGGGGGGGNL